MSAMPLDQDFAPRLAASRPGFPGWLRALTLLVVAGLHGFALYGFARYRVEPPPALETLDLQIIAQGDESPENSAEVAEAAPPKDPQIPPDPTPPPDQDPPPDQMAFDPLPEPEPPPADKMAFDPLPEPDPPPPDRTDFDPLPVAAADLPPPPTLRESADAIPLPPPPKPKPKPVVTPQKVAKVEPPPPPRPKPKPKPKPPVERQVNEAAETRPASQAHHVGLKEGQAQDAGMSRATYGAMLLSQIRAHRFYPDAAREAGHTGAAVVAFTVGAGGSMASVSVVQSSGHAELDAAARQIVRSVSATPPPGGAFTASTTIVFR